MKTSITLMDCKVVYNYQNYNAALILLEIMPEYSGEGWYSIRLNKGENPFPNLMKLMKS